MSVYRLDDGMISQEIDLAILKALLKGIYIINNKRTDNNLLFRLNVGGNLLVNKIRSIEFLYRYR